MNSDGFIAEIVCSQPLEGQYDGIDPALPDALYPATRAPLLVNIRCADGHWATRTGLLLDRVATGSGATRLLDVLYTSGGGRFRLLARGDNAGAVFYDLEAGVDTNFVATSGGTGLGTTTSTQPYFHGASIGDTYIFSDRFGVLRKYATTGTVTTVAQPVAPAVSPRTRPWTYRMLDTWTGGGTFGWTESDSGNFDVAAGGTYDGVPMGANYAKLSISGTGAKNDTISKDVSGEELGSHTIAFYYLADNSVKRHLTFGIGLATADEFVEVLWAPSKEEWFPVFMPVGDFPTINHKQFRAIRARTSQDFYVTSLFLPGYLQGEYRWVYTHYDPTTGRESAPSPISNSGVALDFTAIGVTRATGANSTKAFQKSCMLDFTSDIGVDVTTTKVRFYRSGGVPELTIGPDGRNIWLRVGEVGDVSTLLNGAHLAADTTLAVDDELGFAANDWIVIAKGTSTEEYQKVVSAIADVLTVTPGLLNGQGDNATVQMAFLDNVANEAIDVLHTVDEERDNPPTGGHWVQRAPDGRLWIFRYTSQLTGVRVSNRSTPERVRDYEVFPDDVDPQTRLNPLQGWSFDIGAEAPGEEIIWGGFWRGLPHILTRNKMYRVNALSQTDWGPNAIQKVLDAGCIAGETVKQDGEYIYWMSEGNRVVRWNGEGPLEVLSHQRVSERLSTALVPAQWFARVWENSFGKYYSIWFDYVSGNLGNTSRLDYNITQNAWEECFWYASNGAIHGWQTARVYDGGTDGNELIMVSGRGYLYQSDFADDDDGVPIAVNWQTKKFDLGGLGEVREVYVRLAGVTDELTLTVTVGGSEIGDVERSYPVDLSGSGDVEVRIWVERVLKGRWCQLSFSGNVSSRPAVRDIRLFYRPLDTRRYLGGD